MGPFVQIDSLMAEAVRRGGAWIACRPGCAECCLGPFSISPPDAQYLRGYVSQIDPLIARRVRERAFAYMAAIDSYDEDGLPEGMDEVPCPALDPATRCCDLYEARPTTCRTFGPALKMPDGAIGTCALCFEGATEEQLAECAVEMSPELWELDVDGATFVAAALADPFIP